MGWNITFRKLRGDVTWVTPESLDIAPNEIVQLEASNTDGQDIYYEIQGDLPEGWKLFGNGRLEIGPTEGTFNIQVKAS